MPAAVEKPSNFFSIFSYVCRLVNGEDIRRRKKEGEGSRQEGDLIANAGATAEEGGFSHGRC